MENGHLRQLIVPVSRLRVDQRGHQQTLLLIKAQGLYRYMVHGREHTDFIESPVAFFQAGSVFLIHFHSVTPIGRF